MGFWDSIKKATEGLLDRIDAVDAEVRSDPRSEARRMARERLAEDDSDAPTWAEPEPATDELQLLDDELLELDDDADEPHQDPAAGSGAILEAELGPPPDDTWRGQAVVAPAAQQAPMEPLDSAEPSVASTDEVAPSTVDEPPDDVTAHERADPPDPTLLDLADRPDEPLVSSTMDTLPLAPPTEPSAAALAGREPVEEREPLPEPESSDDLEAPDVALTPGVVYVAETAAQLSDLPTELPADVDDELVVEDDELLEPQPEAPAELPDATGDLDEDVVGQAEDVADPLSDDVDETVVRVRPAGDEHDDLTAVVEPVDREITASGNEETTDSGTVEVELTEAVERIDEPELDGPRYRNSLDVDDDEVVRVLRVENYPHLGDVPDTLLYELSRTEEDLMRRASFVGSAFSDLMHRVVPGADLWQAAIWVTGMHHDPMVLEGMRRVDDESTDASARWLGWSVWPYASELLGASEGLSDPAQIRLAIEALEVAVRTRDEVIASGPDSMGVESVRYPVEAQGIFKRPGFRWLHS